MLLPIHCMILSVYKYFFYWNRHAETVGDIRRYKLGNLCFHRHFQQYHDWMITDKISLNINI